MEKEIRFIDGYYHVREIGGDTICGKVAHEVMSAMNKHYNYAIISYDKRIKFIEDYIKQSV
jgi:hypothetical protein